MPLQQDARWQMIQRSNRRLLQRAQTSYTPAWLLSFLLYQVSTRETAGVLLNTNKQFESQAKGGGDLELYSAYTVHDEHKSKGIMADMNQKFVCERHPLRRS